jgi:YVTN family beta-propeller protein
MQHSRFYRLAGLAPALALVVAGFQPAPAPAAPAAPTYAVLQTITLGGEGGWDYLTCDAPAHRLYISRGNRVDVVDLDKNTIAGTVDNTPGVHGIAIANRIGRGFTSNGREDTVTIFDLKTLKELGRPKVGTGPDAIIFDPASNRAFTFNGRSNDATAVDAATGTVAGTIPLGGRPEFATPDGQGHVYVNIEDKNQIVQIDSKVLKVLNTWSLAPGDGPSGIAIDRAHRRIFSTCHNGMMVVMDADTGKVVATPAIGQGPDAAGYDSLTRQAFSSNGDGTLSVIHEDTPDTFSVTTVPTEPGARTMALDRQTDKIYLVTAKRDPNPPPPDTTPPATGAPPRYRGPRMLPGTFTLIVVGPAPATTTSSTTSTTTITTTTSPVTTTTPPAK